MFGSYRRYIIATIGCLVAVPAIWAGSQYASVRVDSPRPYPEYRESPREAQDRFPTPTLAQAAKAAKQEQPCQNAQGKDASELCAQWSAADAAQRASRWAWWQMIFSFFGVIGLIVTLAFNFDALQRARKGARDTRKALTQGRVANKIARETAQRQLRAYLDFDGVTVSAGEKPTIVGARSIRRVFLSVRIKNFGQTPAENLVFTTNNYIEINGKRSSFTEEGVMDFDSVAPGDISTHNAYWEVPEDIWSAIEGRRITLVVSVFVTYQDAFKRNRVLRSDFETLRVEPLTGNPQDLGFVPGTRKST